MRLKNLLFCFLAIVMLTSIESSAQVVFSEDFDGIPTPTAGGAGTYAFPSGWFLRNVDNRTPAAAVSYVNEAWERREDFSFNVMDSVAFSTSWYSPAGAADDWMWTPMITLPAYTVLTWNAVTYDASYPDGYEVRIMTSGPPTGGTGAIGNQITNSTVIFSTPAEATSWTSHSVNLSSYAGQSVYIGFRNNSNDKFLLLIDDVKVEVQINYDAMVTKPEFMSEYTEIPLQQAAPIPLTASIKNKGLLNLTSVKLKTNIYDAAHVLVASNLSPAFATLKPDSVRVFNSGFFTPSTAGNYTFEFVPVATETDMNLLNDTVKKTLIFTDTIYARDMGPAAGGIGIGAGNGGYIGNQFTINTATSLRSITYGVTKGYLGEKTACVVWSTTGGVPSSIIASTDTITYPSIDPAIYTLQIHGGPVNLTPGDYVFTVVEFDSTVQISQTTDIFTTGKVWVFWPTIPSGNWTNVEAFGGTFSKSCVIRPNLYKCPVISGGFSVVHSTCASCTEGSISFTPSGGIEPYTFLWSNAATTQNISGLIPGKYIVTVTDAMLCTYRDSAVVENTVGIKEISSTFLISPNPNNGSFSVIIDNYTGKNGKIEIFNIIGEKIFETKLSNTGSINQKIDVGEIAPGVYNMRLTDDQKFITKQLIIQ